jgi:hypothetical protein
MIWIWIFQNLIKILLTFNYLSSNKINATKMSNILGTKPFYCLFNELDKFIYILSTFYINATHRFLITEAASPNLSTTWQTYVQLFLELFINQLKNLELIWQTVFWLVWRDLKKNIFYYYICSHHISEPKMR